MFNRIVIIGLGLIGGSLAMAIKRQGLANEIIGVSRRRSTIHKAKTLGIVDDAFLDVKRAVKDADLVILSLPVLKIIEIAEEISRFLSPGTLVTDVGSTKKEIVQHLDKIFSDNVNFVGSHPLAGSEKSGLMSADKELFKSAYCILTKTPKTDLNALNKIKRFWKKLGMKIVVMSPDRHDELLSGLSHLPHAVSVGLCNACANMDVHLSAGGFRDTTRIAGGNPEIWRDIFITNSYNIAKDIKRLKRELYKIEMALKNNNSEKLLHLFKSAKDVRDRI